MDVSDKEENDLSMANSGEKDPLYATPLQEKRPRSRFNIGLYAKQKKLLMDKVVVENSVIKSLQGKLNYRKRKSENLNEELLTLNKGPKQPRLRSKESTSSKENTDTLNISRTQEYRRRKDTIEALKPIHCSSTTKNVQPVLDGMFSTIINECTTEKLESMIDNSATCHKIIPNIVKKKVKKYQTDTQNMIRSVKILYKGGILTKRKYKELRTLGGTFMDGVPIPKAVTYDRLMSFIKSINMGEVYDLQEFADRVQKPAVWGVYRPLESFLVRLANMYLELNKVHNLIHWFGAEKGVFLVALGADGAPFGKDETATSFVVSFLNILDGVQSCDNNFLLMGANCDETHELMYEYTRHVFKEMEAIEKKSYNVDNMEVKFRCTLVPSDQKWMAEMAGELNNAATYPSSFGNVSKDNLAVVGGSFGKEKNATWHPWEFKKRMEDIKAVTLFKQKNKIPIDSKVTSDRKKVTTFIAKRKSRQEKEPCIGKYVDVLNPEPLHNTNNAWEAWNRDLLATVVQLTNQEDLNKAGENIDNLPKNSPLATYVSCLEGTFKASRLVKNLKKWFREKKTKEMFSYRFTGKESKMFSWYFMHLCRDLMKCPGIEASTLLHVTALAYSAICLRNSIALYSRVHIDKDDLISLKENCDHYYNCQSMLLTVKPTIWTIGKAIPYYTSKLHAELGFGLGLNSMQGREAKHSKLSCYAKNTSSGKKLRWWQIFRHEFMELIWLREQDMHHLTYRRGAVGGDEKPPLVEGEQYIPPCCIKDGFCKCALPKPGIACDVCDSHMFKLVKSSCLSGQIDKELSVLVPNIDFKS